MSSPGLASSSAHSQSRARQLFFILLVALAVRLLWMAVIPLRAFSVDLKDWRIASYALSQGINPYVRYDILNWPPFWLEILYLFRNISDLPNEYFFFNCLRLLLIAAELILICTTFVLIRQLDRKTPTLRLLLIGMVLNPLLILLTVQHANFDAFAVIWIVLFLCALIRFRRDGEMTSWLLAAACLGMGIFVKTFPLVLWPLLMPGAKRAPWRARLLAVALVVGPAFLSLAPLYVLNPAAISQNVIHYRSTSGAFGVTGLLSIAGQTQFISIYSHAFSIALFSGMIVLAFLLWRRDIHRDVDVVLLAAMLLMSLFTLGSGYGSQYWFWVIPLLVACYPHQSIGFRRILWLCGIIIVANNIAEYALVGEKGRFLFWWFPTQQMLDINVWLDAGRNKAILRLPMLAASLLILMAGCRRLFLHQTRKISASS